MQSDIVAAGIVLGAMVLAMLVVLAAMVYKVNKDGY